MAVQPIECWWRTTSNAVRVGELFDVVLTCAVIHTASTTVVPDQSRLDPAVLQLPPFEVTGGSQSTDLTTPSRRFFQYDYTLRYIGEDFGRDVPLPQLAIAYRVQSRVERDAAAIESRDRQYILPQHLIRIVSLVPLNAPDIRDRAPDTFLGIEQRQFKANVLRILGITLTALSGVMVVWALIRYLTRGRVRAARALRLASDGAILREVGRELDAVSRGRHAEGWTPSLAARALAALRVAGAYAVHGHVAQAPGGDAPGEGQLTVRSPLRPGRTALVSGTVTAMTVERELRRRESLNGQPTTTLLDLHTAFERFNAAAYSRDGSARGDLDDALNSAERAVAAVARENRWMARRWRALGRSLGELRTRVWAR
jgi:hypothetical protein